MFSNIYKNELHYWYFDFFPFAHGDQSNFRIFRYFYENNTNLCSICRFYLFMYHGTSEQYPPTINVLGLAGGVFKLFFNIINF